MAVDNFINTVGGILGNNNINGLMKLDELGGAFQNGLKASKAGWGTMGAGVAQSIGSMIGNRYGEDFSEEQKARQSGFRNVTGMFGPIGQAIALADGIAAGIATATGTGLSNLNKNSADALGLKSVARENDILNSTGLSSLLVGLTGGRTNNYKVSDDAEAMESGYAGTLGLLRAAEDVSGKRVSGWNLRKVNGAIDEQANKDRILQNQYTVNTMAKNSDYNQNLQHQWQNRIAGQNYLGVTVGKNGMKLLSLEDARRIANLKKEPAKLQNGGEIPGIDTSILPEGQLHKNLNHLDNLNPDLEDATKKGIPVMASNGGELVEQTAEIERDEIVFRLEITKQLEELRKDGSEEAMIQAGMLVANEVIENTTDNTGQIIEEVEDGK